MSDILLITPPFTQLNTPYPASAYLKGFLNKRGISSYQIDLGIEVILELFSSKKLIEIFKIAEKNNLIQNENLARIYSLKSDYIRTIDPVITFLQGKNPTLARQVCSGSFLPQAYRFENCDNLEWEFGSIGIQDKAKHLCTLYLEDISDFITSCIDKYFGFSQYAERLGRSAANFDQIYTELNKEFSYIDSITTSILNSYLVNKQPKLVCITVPFPGNLFSAFRCAQFIKKNFPEIKVAMGGGFPNTELRSLTDKRVFEFFDFIVLDDGELPIELLHKSLDLSPKEYSFKRTYYCYDGNVVFDNSSVQKDYKQVEVGTPDYSDLKLESYVSVISVVNPMHSLWSDGRWNKLTMAHGCYWGKCTFCDISLDYIKIYEPVTAKIIVDRMEEMISKTNETGFHFVDEAAPPSLMKTIAIEIIHRNLVVTWWTNIRFEKSFTRDLCILLKQSGCIAISGGLEVASDRLLKLINKGVTVEQVARVTKNLTDAGIMVHAYLMYGYPTQTIQETIDSLEMVRQLFELEIIQSGFWHQFALTPHSPIGKSPEEYNIIPKIEKISFAHNDIQFRDKTGINHDKFSFGLKKSLYNFMHGIGFEIPVHEWFEFKVPRTNISKNFIEKATQNEPLSFDRPNSKVLWLGKSVSLINRENSKKGKIEKKSILKVSTLDSILEITIETKKAEWFIQIIDTISIYSSNFSTLSTLKSDYETTFEDFELFWYSKSILKLKESGVLLSV
jgi:radical SAM superfamily enzyme YgiQ (UPF0313 family)